MNDIPSKISELDTNKEIIVYCKSGKRSAKVCEYLENNNFPSTQALRARFKFRSNLKAPRRIGGIPNESGSRPALGFQRAFKRSV